MEVKLYQGLLEINWNLLFSAITVLVLYLILKHFFFLCMNTSTGNFWNVGTG